MLREIEKTIQTINAEGEKPDLAPVRTALAEAYDALNRLAVTGRDNLDKLLGCMMAIEQIIGEEE